MTELANPAGASLTFDIGGMTCAACAARIETVLRRAPGITGATVNLALERADVEADAGITADRIIDLVDRAGYTATLRTRDPAAGRRQQEALETTHRAAFRQLATIFVISALLTAPFIVGMIAMIFGDTMLLSPTVQLILAGLVQLIAGTRFYRGAWHALKGGSANMDVLVSLGTTAAFGWSVWILFASHHAAMHLYFEASATILTLVLLGKLLEERAKASTTAAIRSLMALRPETATRLTASGEETVAIDDIRVNDLLLTRPGERFAVDGIVKAGEGHVDESAVTGESRPVARHPGDRVIGGTINGEGALTVTVTAVGEDTTLSRVTRMVENAQVGKAPVQRLVDRISAIFVPTVLAIAAATLVGWLLAGGSIDGAMTAAIAVLVIACPCALGLATPTALVAGTGAAARAGILIKDIDALERAAGIDHVIFDKTGTLTIGKPALIETALIPGGDADRLLALAASAQGGSEHPLAHALKQAAEDRALILPPAERFRAIVGKGIFARVDDHDIVIGNAALLEEFSIAPGELATEFAAMESRARTAVYLAIDGTASAVYGLADPIRPEARAAIDDLKSAGTAMSLLTGDNAAVAAEVAGQLGIVDWRASVRPADKMMAVAALQKAGHHVAMIGDGVNDAPALAAADIGIAIGTGTDVAIETAGITLMRPDPRLVAGALRIARATRAKIWQNLFFAFGYNIIGIPLAMSGQLTPALAGAAMAMSSVSVVTNAALLARWKP